MTGCNPDLLPGLVFGSFETRDEVHGPSAAISKKRREELREHIEACARCRSELIELTELFAATAATCEPIAPPTTVRDRLMRSLDTGRFSQFVVRIAELFDVTSRRAGELLDWIDGTGRTDRPGSDGASRWEPGPSAASALLHFPGGPACAGADTGFVRVAAGSTFPAHTHNGDETNLVLQGSCTDSDGTTYQRGDLFCNRRGTHHSFTASPGAVDYIFAVRVFDGVCFHEQDQTCERCENDRNDRADCNED